MYEAPGDFDLGSGLCRVDMAHGIACSAICSVTLPKGNELSRHFSGFPDWTIFLLKSGVYALLAPFLPKWVLFDLITYVGKSYRS